MMMLPELPKPSRLHYVFFGIVALALLCITISLGMQYKRITVLEESQLSEPDSTRVDALQVNQISFSEQLGAITQDIGHLQTVTSKSLHELTRSIDERFIQIQSQVQSSQPDLTVVFERLNRLDEQITRLSNPPAPATKKPSPPTHTKPPSPPAPEFILLGVELRGGERLLSVAPKNSPHLQNVRLLRVGESMSGWRLQRFDEHEAIFEAQGQARKLTLPSR